MAETTERKVLVILPNFRFRFQKQIIKCNHAGYHSNARWKNCGSSV